jgi:tetratricopeptide (TPR) repeat protein
LSRADPKAGFDVAVRHLFRHLDNARELRRNPLVSKLFEQSDVPSTRSRDLTAVAQVRRLVVEAVERCYAANSSTLDAERRRRQSVIFRRCVLERNPLDSVAAELGISKRLLYSERANICERIARYIQKQDLLERASALRMLDRLAFQFERAAAQVEAGEYDLAVRNYNGILETASTPSQKIEALCKRAEIELECGRFLDARRTIVHATELSESSVNALSAKALGASRAHIELLRSRTAWFTADFSTASTALNAASLALETVRSIAGKRIKELLLDVLIEQGTRARLDGDFARASRHLADIAETAREIPDVSPQRSIDWHMLRGQVEYQFARPGTTFAMGDYFALLADLLHLAKKCRSLRRILEIEVEFTDPFVRANPGGIGLNSAQHMLSMARELNNRRLISHVSIYMADHLASTNVWKAVPHILEDARRIEVEGSREWGHMRLIEARYHLRAGDWAKAHECGEQAWQAGRSMRSSRVEGAGLRSMADAELKLGRHGDAREHILEALPHVEGGASPEACIMTYRVAAAVTGDRRFSRAATELRQAVTGR